MTENTIHCQKCKQTVPAEAKFCPYCGIELAASGVKDYSKSSYTELVLEAKRIEVAIIKDERAVEQFRKKIEDGSFKLNTLKKIKGVARTEVIETIKKEVLGYKWAPGGLVHPMLSELERIKEELSRRERVDDYQHIEKFIRDLRNNG
jgi:hypothetical protein